MLVVKKLQATAEEIQVVCDHMGRNRFTLHRRVPRGMTLTEQPVSSAAPAR